MKNILLFITFFSFFTSHSITQQYFQQKVNYVIDAELLPETKMVNLNSKMNYTNNSPDNISEIFIRLHWNIFQENSYSFQIRRNSSYYKTKGVEINSLVLNQSGDISREYSLDNTILKIPLKQPLKTGESVSVEINLKEETPPEGLRMGYFGRNFSIAHWFPAVCVYDKYGWHTDQYLGRGEFNEEIGDYQVNLKLPKSYLVFNTGYLLNPEEVLPKEAQENLKTAKSSTAKVRIYDQSRNQITKNDSIVQTWKLKAENVRTFAFTAFENYLWDAQNIDGVLINTVYPTNQEDYYKSEGMKAAVQAIKYFSKLYGPYLYPQMFVTVGGTSGGMEYPGIVFIARSFGLDFFNRALSKLTSMAIIHEIGHNWCPMMINSNETDYAFQDEGFTNFATTLAIEDLYGRKDNFLDLSGFLKMIFFNSDWRSDDQAESIIWSQKGFEEPIMTNSDRYKQSYGYSVNSYQKTESILFMLQYVMGDSAFSDLFHDYYKRFLFKHVYPEDFFNLASEINYKWNKKRDLRWFFDEWFYKTYKLDYAMKAMDCEVENGKYKTSITVERKEDAIMPIDVVIELENGDKKQVWFDVEEFMKGPVIVRKTFEFDSKPKRAEINPDHRLMDINRLNNSTDVMPPVYFDFNPLIDMIYFARPYDYKILWLPAIGFNNIDGFKAGINLSGKYLENQNSFDLTLMQGVKFGKNSFGVDITLSNSLDFLAPQTTGSISFFNYEGRRGGNIKLSKTFFANYQRYPVFKYSFSANYFDANDERYFNASNFDEIQSLSMDIRQRKYFWLTTDFSYSNSFDNLTINHSLKFEGGAVKQSIPQFTGDEWKSTYLKVSYIQSQRINIPFFNRITLRQYLGYSPVKIPSARSFYLSTVNPIDEYNYLIYRTAGIISNETRQKRSVPNGGGYLRGYYDRNLYGDMIGAFNADLSLNWISDNIPVINIFNSSFFIDAGNVWNSTNEIRWNNFLTDYGFSFKIPFGNSSMLSFIDKLGISEIRFDFPIFVSHPVNGEDRIKFRWLIGFQSPF